MNYRSIYHDDKQQIVGLFVGKSVNKISDDRLVLSDGTVLQVVPNEGGCSCGAGDYKLTELNGVENIITNVELITDYEHSTYCDERDGGCYCEGYTTYQIFVYSGHTKINLATIQGSDGNGYYGTGFSIRVRTNDNIE